MTKKWLSYRGVPLQGHLHVANQQKKIRKSDRTETDRKIERGRERESGKRVTNRERERIFKKSKSKRTRKLTT